MLGHRLMFPLVRRPRQGIWGLSIRSINPDGLTQVNPSMSIDWDNSGRLACEWTGPKGDFPTPQ